jgi:hypothetical protein
MQLTNHYDEYWSHNVLMLGYYNNDQWNLLYRTDELSGFNKEIESDNETYVNATLWKDLSYAGYDFRLAIRYHLGIDDNELTVIPYIKNLGMAIPYTLGFGWEMKDIQIDMTTDGDYINVDGTMYYLNQTLDNVYTDLLEPEFYLMENITNTNTKSLYLKWNQSLTYKLCVKSREDQYNAPVTLFIKIGTLNAGQEKYTKLFWYDADQVIYYFDSYDNNEVWATNPVYMVDGCISNFASTTVNGDVELCNGNNCSGADLGTISTVELRVYSYYSSGQRDTILRPVYGGTNDGMECRYQTVPPMFWSEWFDITCHQYAPQPWGWTDIVNLDCDVEAESDLMGPPFTLYCSKVEIRVTYTPYSPPEISDPFPSNGNLGISICPTLNITVSDAGGDSMNITWLSNSSGSWQVFGSNCSVANGTYHQIMNNSSENGKWWFWKVNVSDGESYTESSVYKFYTGCESKIENTGSTDISGYLFMQVQYYFNLSDDWIVVDDIIDEDTPRTISAGGYLALDSIFNGLVNSSILRYGNGTYCVYVALRDPNCNVLKWDDCEVPDFSHVEKSYNFAFITNEYCPWRISYAGGFGDPANHAARGAEIYNGELYVGTQNVNFNKLDFLGCNGFLAGTDIKMADESYKDIEDIEIDDQVKAYDMDNNSYVTANVTDVYCFSDEAVLPDHYVTINNKLHISPYHLLYVNGTLTNASDVVTGDFFVDVNGSNVTVNSLTEVSTNKEKMYNLMVSENPEVYDIQRNLTFFAEDIPVYPLGSDGGWLPGDFLIGLQYLFKDIQLLILLIGGSLFSDGCEIWKYNYYDDDWKEVVGSRTGEGEIASGFGDHNNFCLSAMKVFKDKLYVGTWQSPWYGGEIWRYDGLTWEPVVGRDAKEEDGYSGGFGNPDHHICSMEVFKDYLYVGTCNLVDVDSGCQVWRTATGDADTGDWELVVDEGFRGFGADSHSRNYYAWCMEEFYDNLYVGTCNGCARKDVGWGCQLFRTANGVNWGKVDLKNGDGFGEWENLGIRRLVNYSDNLYCGIAANTDEDKGFELWKYDGVGSDGNGWVCIIGEDSSQEDQWYKDGFGDKYNKYPWSMAVCGNELWIGTNNVQQISLIPLKYESKGCEVWRYDGENLEPNVKTAKGFKQNGFGSEYEHGNTVNAGAWSMIEYPKGSGIVVAGTWTSPLANRGSEVWIWDPYT